MSQYQKVSDKKFWEEKYAAGNVPWDINQVAPAFVKYFSRGLLQQAPTTLLKVAILGCGRGHDAFYFADIKEGEVNEPRFQIYGFDFSESAIKFCNEVKNKKNLNNTNFYQIDFFNLIKEEKWNNFFDCVIEHTSFCAIDPRDRKKYVELINYLLKPGGRLVGLFFIRPIELGGPPYGIEINEVRELLKDNFTEVEKLHHEECPHAFTGKEYFGVFEKKSL